MDRRWLAAALAAAMIALTACAPAQGAQEAPAPASSAQQKEPVEASREPAGGQDKINRIVPAQLSWREEQISRMGCRESRFFDFTVDPSCSRVKLTVSRYEFGEPAAGGDWHSENLHKNILLENQWTQGLTGWGVEAGRLDESREMLRMIIMSCTQDGSSRTTAFTESLAGMAEPANPEGPQKVLAAWQVMPEGLPFSDKMLLAALCYAQEAPGGSLSGEFFSDPQAHLDELVPYDVAYLLRCEFLQDGEADGDG